MNWKLKEPYRAVIHEFHPLRHAVDKGTGSPISQSSFLATGRHSYLIVWRNSLSAHGICLGVKKVLSSSKRGKMISLFFVLVRKILFTFKIIVWRRTSSSH
jgi:hypothetical protein